jgi:carbonic anhydrase
MLTSKLLRFYRFFSGFILLSILFINFAISQDELIKLKSGNDRYATGQMANKDFLKERSDLVKGQQPYAIILSCADSRVAPEYIFDESLGQLFVIRVAGNVINPDVLGSIEYAIEHLKSKFLVIMGHESCGAVKATLEGGSVPPNIGALLYKIKPAVKFAKSKNLDKDKTLDLAIEENVNIQIKEALKQSKIIKETFEKGELKIYGALYNLHTGKVEFQEYKEK